MGKRLILILALAFVVGIAFGAYAEVQNVKVSGDITVYGIMRELTLNNNQFGGDITTPAPVYSNDKHQSLATITRLKVDADLTDNVMATVRLLNERYWGSSDETVSNTDIDLDLALVTLKEFLYSPATLMVGRQELFYGNGMIIGDARSDLDLATSAVSPLASDYDLSARKAFDAIRLVLNYDPLILDFVMAKIEETTTSRDDDVDLYGINANYSLDKTTNLEGYIWQKRTGRKTTAQNKPDIVNTVGGRVVLKPADVITLQAEAAYQFGQAVIDANNMAKRRAYALQLSATVAPKDVKYSPTITGLYSYFTGKQENDVKIMRGWDPMYESQKVGDIANTQFPQSNAHVLGIVGTAAAASDVTLKGEYYAYWWDKQYGHNQVIVSGRGDSLVMEQEKFAGQEVDLTATYDYTEDVQFSLLTGMFFPGTAFSSRNDNTATEVIGSMKVTF